MGEPGHFQSNQEPHGDDGSLRLGRPPGTVRRRLDLQQRQSCVIEKHPSGWSQRHAARLALQQVYANFSFEIADLAAQRGLRGVQSVLGSGEKTAFLGDSDEIAQMTKFHPPSYIFKA